MANLQKALDLVTEKVNRNRQTSDHHGAVMNKAKIFLILFSLPVHRFPSKRFGHDLQGRRGSGPRVHARSGKKRYTLIQDPVIKGYLTRLCNKIQNVADGRPFTYRFYIIQEPSYNAFAGPAGHVFINSGLFMDLESESELAGIMAHELAHVNCRHIAQKVERSKSLGLATLAGVAAGILLAMGGAASAANAVTVGTMAAGQSAMLAYSRENEMQADQVALRYLSDAGFGGEGLLTSLKKIRSRQWYGSSEIPTYLSTHPASEDRIAYIDNWLQTRPDLRKPKSGEKKQNPLNADSFEFVRIRLLALYADPEASQRKLDALRENIPDTPLFNYGQGLFLGRTGNRREAVTHFRKALEKAPFNPVILTDLGKVYFFDGQLDQALSVLGAAREISRNDPETAYFLGRALLESNQVKQSIDVFSELLIQYPDFSQTLYYMGEAYGKSGDLANAHYYLGRQEEESGNWKNAGFHYKKALEKTTDPAREKEIAERMKKNNEPQRPQRTKGAKQALTTRDLLSVKVGKLHGECSPSLGCGTKGGGITEHIGQWHDGVYNLDRALGRIFSTFPPLAFSSPMTSPVNSSGTNTSTAMNGSSR